jgi:hypothetical protein
MREGLIGAEAQRLETCAVRVNSGIVLNHAPPVKVRKGTVCRVQSLSGR